MRSRKSEEITDYTYNDDEDDEDFKNTGSPPQIGLNSKFHGSPMTSPMRKVSTRTRRYVAIVLRECFVVRNGFQRNLIVESYFVIYLCFVAKWIRLELCKKKKIHRCTM